MVQRYDPLTGTYYETDYTGDVVSRGGPLATNTPPPTTPQEASGSKTPDYVNPLAYEKKPFIPIEKKRSLRNYLDYVSWKRREMANLIKQYRNEYPKQIDYFKEAAYGNLERQSPEMWGQMYTNLDRRGLSDSPNFLTGAKQEHSNWRLNEEQSILDTASQMEDQAQQSILAALGKPDFAGNYARWSNLTQQMNEYFDSWFRKNKLGPYKS